MAQNDQMRRVLSLETLHVNDSGAVTKRGAKQTFDYQHMCTVVTAVEDTASDAGKKLYYQFNDSGNVVAMRDELGYGQFTKFEAGVDNKPSEISKLRKVVDQTSCARSTSPASGRAAVRRSRILPRAAWVCPR